jgi:hypothetical protein
MRTGQALTRQEARSGGVKRRVGCFPRAESGGSPGACRSREPDAGPTTTPRTDQTPCWRWRGDEGNRPRGQRSSGEWQRRSPTDPTPFRYSRSLRSSESSRSKRWWTQSPPRACRVTSRACRLAVPISGNLRATERSQVWREDTRGAGPSRHASVARTGTALQGVWRGDVEAAPRRVRRPVCRDRCRARSASCGACCG